MKAVKIVHLFGRANLLAPVDHQARAQSSNDWSFSSRREFPFRLLRSPYFLLDVEQIDGLDCRRSIISPFKCKLFLVAFFWFFLYCWGRVQEKRLEQGNKGEDIWFVERRWTREYLVNFQIHLIINILQLINLVMDLLKGSYNDHSEDISLYYSCVVFVAYSKTSEEGQILGLALLDLEDYPKEVSQYPQALHSIRRNSSQLDGAGFSLAQSHESKDEPLIVSGDISAVLYLIQKSIQGLSSKDISGSDFEGRVIGNCCSSGGFCLKTQAIARGKRGFISFVEVTVYPNIRQVLQQFGLASILDFVENTRGYLATSASPPDSLYIPLLFQIYLVKLANGRNDNMNVPSTIWQIASTDNLHRELVVDLVMIFQEGDQLGLNNVNRVVLGMIGESVKMNIQSSLADDSHQQQVFQIIGDASLQSALEMQLHSFIVGDHTSKELEQKPSLRYHDLAAIGDCLYEFEEP